MMSREASRAPKLWYRTPVGPWSMCRQGQEGGGLYTVPDPGSDTLYFFRGRLASGGWMAGVGGLEGWVHGWVRLEVPWCPGALVPW